MKNVEYFGVFLYPTVCLVPACGRERALTDLEIGTYCVLQSIITLFRLFLQAESLPHATERLYITV